MRCGEDKSRHYCFELLLHVKVTEEMNAGITNSYISILVLLFGYLPQFVHIFLSIRIISISAFDFSTVWTIFLVSRKNLNINLSLSSENF